MEKRYVNGIVAEKRDLGGGIMDMWLMVPEIAAQAAPGQFVALYCTDGSRLLPRPISICDVDEERQKLRLVFRLAGEGTKELAATRVFDGIPVLGPLGNGYPENVGERPLLVGGGIGIPPMLFLAKQLWRQGRSVSAVLGYRDSRMFLAEDFAAYADVFVATDDGSVGIKGTVVDAIRENEPAFDWLGACGPMPMLRGIKALAEERNVPAYISLEERMACGIGACLGCVCRTKNRDAHTHVNNSRICKEGPVFDAQEVEIG